jgi:hypothetical protein
MSGYSLVLLLQVATGILAACVAGKLYSTGLYSRYRAFFWYMLFRVFEGVWPVFVNMRSNLYAYIWTFTEPVSLILYVLVVLELCRLVLEKHRGLYTLGRWAVYLGMAISVGLSILSLLPRIKPNMPQSSKYLGYIFAVDRGVTLCLAIFLVLMLFLLSRYPVSLSRNVILHAAVYTIFFLCNALDMILLKVLGFPHYPALETGRMIVSCLCLLCWLRFLSPKGEETRVQIPHFRPEHEERLLYQLDAINTTMLKISRN